MIGVWSISGKCGGRLLRAVEHGMSLAPSNGAEVTRVRIYVQTDNSIHMEGESSLSSLPSPVSVLLSQREDSTTQSIVTHC